MTARVSAEDSWDGVFGGAVGLWLGLGLLKFGNPVILDQKIPAPTNREELIFQAWPVSWGYWLLTIVVLLGFKTWRWKAGVPSWLLGVLGVWLGWQAVAATQTVEMTLTLATLKHFVSCVVCFGVGLFALSRVERLSLFWLGLGGGFLIVLAVGWEQHFGGLERTRRFFYELPNWQSYPPEFLKKVESRRIYSTLVYPNALAGVVLLLSPVILATLWRRAAEWPKALKHGGAAIIAVAGAACLYWSGSKAGWLIALGQGTVAFLHAGWSRRVKWLAVGLILLTGLGGFVAKNVGYFERGATSVTARMDYWRAAAQTMGKHPLLGSGPGTFLVSYRQLKTPEAEMTRLTHNDYLQQGSDSGVVGLLAYAGFVFGALVLLYRKHRVDGRLLAIWVGCAGLAAQSLVEFGLYIPALSWAFFLLLGFGLGTPLRRPPAGTLLHGPEDC